MLAILGAGIGYYGYKSIFASNTNFQESKKVVYIPTGTNMHGLEDLLYYEGVIKDRASYNLVAKLMKYDKGKVNTGKYTFAKGSSNRDIIGKMRSGRQTPVNVTFNNIRMIDQFAGKASVNLELDSATLLTYLESQEVLDAFETNAENIVGKFIPNTYEMYWNTSKEDFVKRMKKEYENFWSKNDRRAKAKKMNMTEEEVATLAAIVQKESLRNDEKPRIAGVYHNRLLLGMPLQADPTVVFALKQFDLRRVLFKHLEYDSPYNTYKYPGLPPGPICMPAITSLDAVLNREDHKYLYFCSNPEVRGGHLFAESLAEHNANARVYHRWLDSKGIR